MAIDDKWGTLKGGCPNCGGDLSWSYFGADCRGNPPSAGTSCLSKCGFECDWCLDTEKRVLEFIQKDEGKAIMRKLDPVTRHKVISSGGSLVRNEAGQLVEDDWVPEEDWPK